MLKKIIRVIREIQMMYQKHHLYTFAGNIAFFALWSLIPFMIVWEGVVRFFSFYSNSEGFITDEISGIIKSLELNSFSFAAQDFFFIIILFYLSSKAFTSLIFASNSVFNETASPRFFLDKIKGFVFTIMIVILLVFLFTIPVVGAYILEFVYNIIPKLDGSVDWIINATWPITIIVTFVSITFIYTFAPTKYNSVMTMLPGAVFTTVLWIFFSRIYSYYIANFANYAEIYGLFSSVISLMIWLYILSQILIIGLVINGVYREHRR